MDADVIAISRLLAVRTLQLEMEYIYASLEEEAIDVSADELLNKGEALLLLLWRSVCVRKTGHATDHIRRKQCAQQGLQGGVAGCG
jgi:hypothetical protein